MAWQPAGTSSASSSASRPTDARSRLHALRNRRLPDEQFTTFSRVDALKDRIGTQVQLIPRGNGRSELVRQSRAG